MTKPPRGRPPNLAARQQVLDAARALMAEGGVSAVTIEELAARAGVTRPTIYRSWPNAMSVAMAALMAEVPDTSGAVRGRSVEKDLTRVLEGVIDVFGTASGRHAATLIASADPSTELAKAFRHQILLRTRDEIRAVLAHAIEVRELRRNADVDVAADLILAPLFFRLLLGHQPLAKEIAPTIVEHVLNGLKTKR